MGQRGAGAAGHLSGGQLLSGEEAQGPGCRGTCPPVLPEPPLETSSARIPATSADTGFLGAGGPGGHISHGPVAAPSRDRPRDTSATAGGKERLSLKAVPAASAWTDRPRSGPGACSGVWDNITCWRPADVGETVTVPCPQVFSTVHSKAGSISKNCTSEGWSDTFPDLMDACGYHDPEEESKVTFFVLVKAIYTLGYSVSLISLTAGSMILCLFRKLRCTRNYIHLNLFLSFMLRAVSVLVKDDVLYSSSAMLHCPDRPSSWVRLRVPTSLHAHRAAFSSSSGRGALQVGCKLALALFQYCVMANFYWLLVEGLFLRSLLVAAFAPGRRFPAYLLVGWGKEPWPVRPQPTAGPASPRACSRHPRAASGARTVVTGHPSAGVPGVCIGAWAAARLFLEDTGRQPMDTPGRRGRSREALGLGAWGRARERGAEVGMSWAAAGAGHQQEARPCPGQSGRDPLGRVDGTPGGQANLRLVRGQQKCPRGAAISRHRVKEKWVKAMRGGLARPVTLHRGPQLPLDVVRATWPLSPSASCWDTNDHSVPWWLIRMPILISILVSDGCGAAFRSAAWAGRPRCSARTRAQAQLPARRPGKNGLGVGVGLGTQREAPPEQQCQPVRPPLSSYSTSGFAHDAAGRAGRRVLPGFGAVGASSGVNFVLFVSILRVLLQKLTTPDVGGNDRSQYKRLAKSTLLLIPLFGIHYMVFAVFPIGVSATYQLLFELCAGSFQGLAVAVFYCFLNSEVQSELRRKWRGACPAGLSGQGCRLHRLPVSRNGSESALHGHRGSRTLSFLQTETSVI
ncbi:Vasoactive intestinal polypeptide receptor 2 [Galemys pyrenaicus]|uniref:Vasoactive intestinal polypeptide receptor 2 n=1 Tax=Galemys pyrenaicus TaxID=202257 RepID=A0A8J5ZT44_GALPY|nr:Vasoactive intestinal polypeptide receptor 2 [Galemys pyrenaicus]